MLIIIRPGSDVFQWASLYMLGSATLLRRSTRSSRAGSPGYDSAETTAVYSALVGTVVMSLAVPFVWTPIASWTDAAILFSLGIIGGTAHYFVARAMTYAQASIIAPFGYWQLIGSVVVGYLISGLSARHVHLDRRRHHHLRRAAHRLDRDAHAAARRRCAALLSLQMRAMATRDRRPPPRSSLLRQLRLRSRAS